MPEGENERVVHELARLWNDDDVEAYLGLFTPDIVFSSSESWPERYKTPSPPAATGSLEDA